MRGPFGLPAAIVTLFRAFRGGIIGGIQTGDRRGDQVIDIQTRRADADNVSTALRSISIGNNLTTTAEAAVNIGQGNTVDGKVGVGTNLAVSGIDATAIGYASEAAGDNSIALGTGAVARRADTINIAGAIIIKDGSSGEPNWQRYYSGAEVVIFSRDIDLTLVADYGLALSSNLYFWLSECGIICTAIDAMTVQPTVRFGVDGDEDKQVAATQTTLLTDAHKREAFTPLIKEDGEGPNLVAGVTVGATADAMTGRFYFKGLLVEIGV